MHHFGDMYDTYAQALWKLAESGMKPKEAVAKLQERLVADGRENLLPHIARAFARLAERKLQQGRVVLSVAREKDAAKAKRATKEILRQLDVEPADIALEVDDTLIGGWRFEGRERLYDASFKKHLLSIYNAATR